MRTAANVSDEARRQAMARTDFACAECPHRANYVVAGLPYCGCCHATAPSSTSGGIADDY